MLVASETECSNQSRIEELALEWIGDGTDRTIHDFGPGSHKDFLWRCRTCGHEWKATMGNRTRGTGCPKCAGKVVTKDNCLSATHPVVAAKWDYGRNAGLTPENVKASSHKRVYFLCAKGHSTPHYVYQMVMNGGCKICAGQVATPEENLEAWFPEVAAQWHPTKNGDLKPSMVRPRSHNIVWWLCPRGHVYEMTVDKRTGRGSGCSRCRKGPSKQQMRAYSEIACVFPDAFFNEKVDGLEADIWIPSLRIAIEFDGFPWHSKRVDADNAKFDQWKETGIRVIRLRDSRLPNAMCLASASFKSTICKANVDALLRLIASEVPIDQNLQKRLNAYLQADSFQNTPLFRALVARFGLPPKHGSVSDLAPKVTREWDHEKNAPLTPEVVSYASNERIWFRCSKCGHSYHVRLDHRVLRKSGCPVCAGKLVTPEKSLGALHPQLVKQLHPTLNGDIDPYQIAPQSNKQLYWQCENGHVYPAPPNRKVAVFLRTGRYSGCKECYHESRRRRRGKPEE
jgi:predicted pyridoxine 5'-phosphate oxidase superfamily flavin-nucleotide-binding protein